MNLTEHAAAELAALKRTTPDAIILEFEDEIFALVQKFGDSGQSGGSAPYTSAAITSAITKLLDWKPLGELTGDDDEWGDVSTMCLEPTWQNKRCSAVFKREDGTCTYNDGIVWEDQHGVRFTGRIGNIRSGCKIRQFPFTPKTFIVHVVDDGENYDVCENQSSLIEASKYYDIF